ncbi:hypothetical protein FE257_006456 [Aspergillus nanangensis]|uniref:Major facilitator superfamily (MFS) profile domain-containing protein n=1 Tax=Aspergillus nanangensis TaxID=2582783 RepID=A0AAD4CXJ1_ASPNN|nr:hypothetical protein FE257_006456 [Aspergillus nanangensis]
MTSTSDAEAVPSHKVEYQGLDLDVDEEYTYDEQRKIIHRIDRRLVSIAGIGYCISLMDRTNVSTASIAGMNEDLGLTVGYRYSLVMLIFFIPYVLLQPFVTATIRRLGPRNFLSAMVLCWGGIMIALTNILAYGLTQMDGVENIAGWRWIFIIEGVITLVIGFLAFAMLVEFPDKAHRSWRFLSQRECAFVLRRLNRDRGDAEPEAFSIGNFLQHAGDIRLWCYGVIFCCLMTVTYGIGYFLPLILRNGMGFSVGESQYLSAPPYFWGCILMLVEGWIGDRYRLRGPIIVLNALMSIVGISLMGLAKGNGVRYFGVFLVTGGVNASAPTVLAYQAANIRGQWKRALGSAIMIGMGGIGGIAGSLVFRSQDAPQYYPGIYAMLTASVLVIVLVIAMSVYFVSSNRKARRNLKMLEGSAEFRYTL